MTYISLNKKFLGKTIKDAEKRYLEENNEDKIDESNEDVKNLDWMEEHMGKEEECYVNNIESDGTISVIVNNELGYFGIDVALDDDDFCKLIEIAVKRLNKFKNVLESLK